MKACRQKKSLEEVKLSRTCCQGEDWCGVFEAAKALHLSRLQFNCLQVREKDYYQDDLEVQEAGNQIVKSVEGLQGVERYCVMQHSARMVGNKAVEAGLDAVVSYLKNTTYL